MSLPQGLTASKSVGRLRTFGVKNVKDVPLMKVREYSSGSISDDGRKSEKELPALAAQLRAFSSLSPLPPLQSTRSTCVPLGSFPLPQS